MVSYTYRLILEILTMCTNLRAVFLCLMAITVSMLTMNVRPAGAQSATDDTYSVLASRATRYARYYAPYAIQAAAAYLPVQAFNDKKELKGADVDYSVQKIFGGDVKPAQKAIEAWQYQFGSDSYLTCFDPTDTDCQSALRNKGWDFGSGPSFQVWARTRSSHAARDVCTEVSIAFRGTMGLNGGIGSQTLIGLVLLTMIITISSGVISMASSVR